MTVCNSLTCSIVLAVGAALVAGDETPAGHRLAYRVDWGTTEPGVDARSDLVRCIRQRLDSLHVANTTSLPKAEKLVVDVYGQDPRMLAFIREVLQIPGELRLRVVADRKIHRRLLQHAQGGTGDALVFSPAERLRETGANPIGLWAEVGRETAEKKARGALRSGFSPRHVLRDSRTKEPIDLTECEEPEKAKSLDRWLREQGHENVEVLLVLDDGCDVGNRHVKSARPAVDSSADPSVDFEMTREGALRLERLTSGHKPKGPVNFRLAIVVDQRVISAPTIRSTITTRGQITGKFSPEETRELAVLLNARPLPAELARWRMEEGPLRKD